MSSAARPRIRLARIAAAAGGAVVALLLGVSVAATILVAWPRSPDAPSIFFVAMFTPLVVSFGGVGALIAYRAPRNRLGWLMLAIAVLAGISVAGGTLSAYDLLVAGRRLPGGDLVIWASNWGFQPGLIIAAFFLPLLFPTGHLPSPRWRPFMAVGIYAVVSTTLESAFGPWGPGQFPGVPNPYELHGTVAQAIAAASTIANLTSAPALLIVFASLVLRFRRSRGVEREQFKWFAYAAVVTLFILFVSNVTPSPVSDVAFGGTILSVAFLPVAIGIAILRYRLYDIDLVINRTLVYGSMTVVLAAVYAASVLVFGGLLSPFSHAGSLSIAASTLVVAGLFVPVRTRMQRAVDRRFYRRRYDAVREIASFSLRVRDEVEAPRLTAAVVTTLDRTVQPRFASVWLRAVPRR